MKGLGHAILCGKTLIGNESFAVVLTNDLCNRDDDPVLMQMLHVYEKYQCDVLAIEEVNPKEVHKYGVIVGESLDDNSYRITDMVEKPPKHQAPSYLAIICRYLLTTDIFSILKGTSQGKNGELQNTDTLQTQAQEGMVVAYKFKGKRFDCGSVDGFVEATNHFYNLSKENI